jgi:hypothetical protein
MSDERMLMAITGMLRASGLAALVFALGNATAGCSEPAVGNDLTGGGGGGGAAAGSSGGSAVGGDSRPDGIELAGIQTLTLTSSGGAPMFMTGPCTGMEPDVYWLDFATQLLTEEYCAVAQDGVTSYRAQESRFLSNLELVAVQMMLERISTQARNTCGADKPVVVLTLGFSDHDASYQDDFYAGCYRQPTPVTFVSNMDGLWYWLQRSYANVPTNFEQLSLGVSPLKSSDLSWMGPCDTSLVEEYVLDVSLGTLETAVCSKDANGLGVSRTVAYAVSAADLAEIQARVSELQLGASRDCGVEQPVQYLTLTKDGLSYGVGSDNGACPGNSGRSPFAVGLGRVTDVLRRISAEPGTNP